MVLNSRDPPGEQNQPQNIRTPHAGGHVTQTHRLVGYHSSLDQEPQKPLQNIVQF